MSLRQEAAAKVVGLIQKRLRVGDRQQKPNIRTVLYIYTYIYIIYIDIYIYIFIYWLKKEIISKYVMNHEHIKNCSVIFFPM